MGLEDLTPEQREKIAGKTPEEILEIAKEDGYELTEDEIQEIFEEEERWSENARPLVCRNCGNPFMTYDINRAEGTMQILCDRCGQITSLYL